MITKVIFDTTEDPAGSKTIFLDTATKIIRVTDADKSTRSEIGLFEVSDSTHVVYNREHATATFKGDVDVDPDHGRFAIRDGGEATLTPSPEIPGGAFNDIYTSLTVSREQES